MLDNIGVSQGERHHTSKQSINDNADPNSPNAAIKDPQENIKPKNESSKTVRMQFKLGTLNVADAAALECSTELPPGTFWEYVYYFKNNFFLFSFSLLEP